jgi:DNA repair exonuclease SbcCD nuclease subunit
MVRFAHTADWQLGMTRHYLSPGAQGRFDQARLDAIERLGRIAAAQGCEFVVVCGDVFEYVQVARRTAAPALRALAALPLPVYLLPGNHDHLSTAGIYASHWFGPEKPANVHVLDRPGVVEVRPGVELLAAPWDGKQPPLEQIDRLAARAPIIGPDRDDETARGAGTTTSTVRIAVGHGGVDTGAAKLMEDPIRVAALEAALAERRIDVVVLGDRHSKTPVGATGRIWYSGAPEPTSTREDAPGYLLVIDIEPGRAPTVTPHQVATWTFAEQAFTMRGADSVDDVIGWLDAFPEPARTVAKPILRGDLALADHARLVEALDHRRDLFAAIPASARSDLRIRSDDGDFAELRLTGFAADALGELRDAASGQPAGSEAMDALTLLLRLAGSAGAIVPTTAANSVTTANGGVAR